MRLPREVVTRSGGSGRNSCRCFGDRLDRRPRDVEQAIELVRQLAPLGVDLIDCSSGGNVATARIPLGPGYQTAFAAQIRRATGVSAGAVGMILGPGRTSPSAAVRPISFSSRASCCAILTGRCGRRELRASAPWPAQYLRAAPHGGVIRKASELTSIAGVARCPPGQGACARARAPRTSAAAAGVMRRTISAMPSALGWMPSS